MENRQTRLLRISKHNIEKLSSLKEKTSLKTFDSISARCNAHFLEFIKPDASEEKCKFPTHG